MITPIKWSGSKRSQAPEIAKYINKNYDTYYELFCGGCSMLFYLLENKYYADKFKRFVCNDINSPLIDLYNLIKTDWGFVQNTYITLWKELNKDNDLERKKSYFAQIRNDFNKTHKPELFFFIMRTTTNGMPRYNKEGDFNNSFHVTRNGMMPSETEGLLRQSSYLLRKYDVEFYSKSFEEYKTGERDLLYLDPPYFNTKGMYYGTIDFTVLWKYLKDTKSNWSLSFDGKAGEEDNTVQIPEIYDDHLYINNGNSSFRRVIGKSKDTIVEESLYLKLS